MERMRMNASMPSANQNHEYLSNQPLYRSSQPELRLRISPLHERRTPAREAITTMETISSSLGAIPGFQTESVGLSLWTLGDSFVVSGSAFLQVPVEVVRARTASDWNWRQKFEGMMKRSDPRRLSAVLIAAAAMNAGCALSPPNRDPLGAASLHDDAAVSETTELPAGSYAPPLNLRDWTLHTRAGREAMATRRFDAAEASFTLALEDLATQPPDDVRVQVVLGHLIKLASIHERLGHSEDATRIMSSVTEYRTGEDPRQDDSLAYEQHFHALVQETLWLAYRPPIEFDPSHGTPIDILITRAAAQYQVDPALVKAVVAAESNFDAYAVSSAGAMGLMQLMPETAEKMGVRAPFKPSENIHGGVRYLRSMLDRYQDLSQALAAYNAGPRAVDRYGSIPPYPETEAYVKRVLRFYQDFKLRSAY